MNKPCKSRYAVIIYLCGIILITAGLVMTVNDVLVNLSINRTYKQVTLMDGTKRHQFWTSLLKTTFNIYLFHVTNPDDILLGELPRLIERGPYVYDVLWEKEILNVHEEEDDIVYKLKKTFTFNEIKTGKLSEDDELVILNAAYVGTINTVASLSVSLLKQYGGYVQYLFAEKNPVFVKAKVKDILFDGVSFYCDAKKYAKMKIICTTLKGRKPPIVWDTDVENSYMYSLFGMMNHTWFGPFRVSRGVKNLQELGQLKPINSRKLNKYWLTDECNTIKGTDGLTWPPMTEPPERLWIYVSEACRSTYMEYKEESKIHDFKVWVYRNVESVWSANATDCYCPIVKREKQCPPLGLVDINKCAKIPVFLSEPHFLFGDQELLDYVPDLKPDVDKHASFAFIDSFTGATIEGYRRYQLNMKMSQQPIDLLVNVSNGYFPIVWVSEGGPASDDVIEAVMRSYRMKRSSWFLQWLPIPIGVIMLLFIPLCCEFSKKKVQMIDSTRAVNTFPSTNIRQRTINRRMRNRSKPTSK